MLEFIVGSIEYSRDGPQFVFFSQNKGLFTNILVYINYDLLIYKFILLFDNKTRQAKNSLAGKGGFFLEQKFESINPIKTKKALMGKEVFR